MSEDLPPPHADISDEPKTVEKTPEAIQTDSRDSEIRDVGVFDIPSQNFEIDSNPSEAPTKKSYAVPFNMLAAQAADYNRMLSQTPNIDYLKSAEGREWIKSLEKALSLLMNPDNVYERALSRASAQWKQGYKTPEDNITAKKRKLGDIGGGNVDGENAALMFNRTMGMGSLVDIPLYRSGIWVTFKTPKNSDLLALEQRIALEKSVLGRSSNGMALSNTSVFIIYHLVNFIFEHIYSHTHPDSSLENLRKVIKITDIPYMVLGLALSIWPDGHPYRRRCIIDPSKCTHVVEEMLSLPKLSWVDNTVLSEWQRKHMLKRNGKRSLEEIQRYQDEFTYPKGNNVLSIKDDEVRLIFDVPAIDLFENTGMRWISDIEKQTDGALGQAGPDENEQVRNSYLFKQQELAGLRQYAHWVKEIKFVKSDTSIVDRDSIDEQIGNLTAELEWEEAFYKGVADYISDSTIVVIGVPRYPCPGCQKEQVAAGNKASDIIPIDVISLFFTLRDLRIFRPA